MSLSVLYFEFDKRDLIVMLLMEREGRVQGLEVAELMTRNSMWGGVACLRPTLSQ
jgi:hypothetical protein